MAEINADLGKESRDLHDIKNAMQDVRGFMSQLVEQNKTFMSGMLAREMGQIPVETMRISDHEKILDQVLTSKSKWENKLLALTGAVVTACLVTISVQSSRSNDKAAEVALHTAEVVKQAVETKAP